MNELSWLLYFADLSNSVSILFGIAGAALVAIAIGYVIMGAAARDTYSCDLDRAERIAYGKQLQRFAWKPLLAGFALFVVTAALPSKTTVMMIAASQTAQQIIETPQGQQSLGEASGLAADSLKLLHKYVQDQLATKDAGK